LNRSHFSIYITFPPYSASYMLPFYPPLPLVPNTQTGPILPSCSVFVKNKWHFCLFKVTNYTGCFIVTFPCLYEL
jgi:hypothetical protein